MLSPFLICPPNTPLSPHPCPCSPTLPLPLPGSGIPLHWGIKPLQDQGPLPLMCDKAIVCYICIWSHVYSLVGALVPGSSEDTGWFILLFLLWGCKPLWLHGLYSITKTLETEKIIGILNNASAKGVAHRITPLLLHHLFIFPPHHRNYISTG